MTKSKQSREEKGSRGMADVRLGRERQVEVRGVVLPFFGLRGVVDAEAEAPGDALDAVRQATVLLTDDIKRG